MAWVHGLRLGARVVRIGRAVKVTAGPVAQQVFRGDRLERVEQRRQLAHRRRAALFDQLEYAHFRAVGRSARFPARAFFCFLRLVVRFLGKERAEKAKKGAGVHLMVSRGVPCWGGGLEKRRGEGKKEGKYGWWGVRVGHAECYFGLRGGEMMCSGKTGMKGTESGVRWGTSDSCGGLKCGGSSGDGGRMLGEGKK